MLCVIAIIDARSREYLFTLQQLSERFGIPAKKLYGHITLATYIADDDRIFAASCKEIISAYSSFTVYYEKIEVLNTTSIIAASPRNENTLFNIHNDIATQWGASMDNWTNNELWKPHTTLLFSTQSDLQVIADAMRKEFTPFFAQVKRIEFSQVTNNKYTIVDHIDLS